MVRGSKGERVKETPRNIAAGGLEVGEITLGGRGKPCDSGLWLRLRKKRERMGLCSEETKILFQFGVM